MKGEPESVSGACSALPMRIVGRAFTKKPMGSCIYVDKTALFGVVQELSILSKKENQALAFLGTNQNN